MVKIASRFSDDDFEDDKPAVAEDTTCTDATKRRAYQEALILKIAVESVAEVARGKLGAYRAYLKEAKKRGVDTKAITKALAVRFQDPDIVLIEIREELKMYDLSGFLPGIRERLLGRFDVQEATGAEEEENQVLIAYDKGVMSGRSGHRTDANPYPANSLGERKWADGWRAGQRAIADEMLPLSGDTGEVGTPSAPRVVASRSAKPPSAKPGRRPKAAPAPTGSTDHGKGDLPLAMPAAVH